MIQPRGMHLPPHITDWRTSLDGRSTAGYDLTGMSIFCVYNTNRSINLSLSEMEMGCFYFCRKSRHGSTPISRKWRL